MNIKPIETQYKGYRFRSRLEARWAVWFDAAGIPWEYEKEGFDIGGEWYLPDFWLSATGEWIEIKPTAPTDREWRLACDLHRHGRHRVLILGGNCGVGEYHVYSTDLSFSLLNDNTPEINPDDPMIVDDIFGSRISDYHARVQIGRCRRCRGIWLNCGDCSYGWGGKCEPGCPSEKANWLEPAFVAARSARFEHGESPQIR